MNKSSITWPLFIIMELLHHLAIILPKFLTQMQHISVMITVFLSQILFLVRNLNRAIFYFIQKEIDTPHIGKRIGVNCCVALMAPAQAIRVDVRCRNPLVFTSWRPLCWCCQFSFLLILIWVGTGIWWPGALHFHMFRTVPGFAFWNWNGTWCLGPLPY